MTLSYGTPKANMGSADGSFKGKQRKLLVDTLAAKAITTG
ncbi:MAG: hypothetical protein QOK23_2577 [Gammaproteobacteria bacterium]|jgi:hypothetical protein|nr:hypothetical protein [Gammaproteobacteria bacterium]